MSVVRFSSVFLLMAILLLGCSRGNNSSQVNSENPDQNQTPAQPGFQLISAGLIGDEIINFANSQWRTFCLTVGLDDECLLGSISVQGDILTLQPSTRGRFGIYRVAPVTGHFEFSAKIADENPVPLTYVSPTGLALIPADENNTPLLNSYTSLFFEGDINTASYAIRDRQPAVNSLCQRIQRRYINDLLDSTCILTGSEKAAMYRANLDGRFGYGLDGRNNYSIPFIHTNGSIRIFRDEVAKVFRYYYGISTNVLGEMQITEGEMELAISHEWRSDSSDKYLAAILTGPGDHQPSVIKDIQINSLPTMDAGSTGTFSAEQRDFTWSGFTGHAVVISFDSNLLPDKQQLVFWTLANNVPAYKLNDQLLFSYEFLELWAADRISNPGAFEPMSDDLRWRNSVEVIENNTVRKIIRWRYPLVNPAYRTISNNIDTVPMGEEWWIIYPDATAYRRVIYSPDSNAIDALPDEFEFSEFLLIAGTQVNPVDYAVSGRSLNLYSLPGHSLAFRPAQNSNSGSSTANSWPEVIASVNLRSVPGIDTAGPTMYAVYANPSSHPNIPQSAALNYDISWHDYQYMFSHWPVSKMPFEFHDKSFSHWKEEVTHSSLVSIQVSDGGKNSAVKEWTSLVGLEFAVDPERLRDRTASWLYPPIIDNLSGCINEGYNTNIGALVLTLTSNPCRFQWGPHQNDRSLVNPAIVLNNFTGTGASITIDGLSVTDPELHFWVKNNTLLIWINRNLSARADFVISGN
jgi:hypothetical protein